MSRRALRTYERSAVWVKREPAGMEFATVVLADGRLSAAGVAIGTSPLAYRLDYTLDTAARFVTSRLLVTSRGDAWGRGLDLRRKPDGTWSARVTSTGSPSLPAAGGDAGQLADALDVDLGLSPVTNLMPVLRQGLLDGGGPVDFVMAWVSVPDLGIHRSAQRYTFVRRTPSGQAVIRFEGSGPWGGDFTANLTFDGDGFVADYPDLAQRVRETLPPLAGGGASPATHEPQAGPASRARIRALRRAPRRR